MLKEDHNCIISLKFGSNWHFTGYLLIIFTFFLSNVLFSVMVAAMFDGG